MFEIKFLSLSKDIDHEIELQSFELVLMTTVY